MKQLFFATLLLTLSLFAVIATKVDAQETASCGGIFGGGTSCDTNGDISVKNTVLNPSTNTQADTLTINDAHFKPGDLISFVITITNTGKSDIKDISVADVVPQYISLSKTPGSYNKDLRTITYTIPLLKAGASKTDTITGRISSDIPGGSPIGCLANVVTVSANGKESHENAAFCIELTGGVGTNDQSGFSGITANTTTTKGGTSASQNGAQVPSTTKGGQVVYNTPSVTRNPSTGPEMLPLLALIPGGIIGLFLRKKATIS